jgi:hypothetical protein
MKTVILEVASLDEAIGAFSRAWATEMLRAALTSRSWCVLARVGNRPGRRCCAHRLCHVGIALASAHSQAVGTPESIGWRGRGLHP